MIVEVLREQGLAEAAAALEQDILATVDEVELEEALEEGAVDLLGVVPVEAVEGLERAEAGGAGSAREIDRDARSLFEVNELLEGLGGAEAALVHMREEGGEGLRAHAETDATQALGEVCVTHRRTPGHGE